jgi:tRNA 2-thiouridine synthesizing protein B
MLHIVNKSPLQTSTLSTCLNVAQSGDVLLIEDAVVAATRGNAAEPLLRDAMGRVKVYALQADMEARGLADRAIEGVTMVDYAGFVDLVAANNSCQSWL